MASVEVLSHTSVLPAGATQTEDENIWRNLLSEVSSKSSSSLQGGTVILLGDKQCGKSSLLSKFEKQELHAKGSSPLEYHVLNVQNDFRDSSYAYQLGTAAGMGTVENLVLPVWTLDGEENFGPLLSFSLPPPSPSKSIVLICASIDSPNLLHSIRRWANIYTQQVNQKYDKATVTQAKNAVERYWQEYVEPVECSMTTSMAAGIEETGLLPLERGVLVENCGSNLVIVITKSDLGVGISDQQSIRILVQVRKLCLELGAALVYTSSKNNKNIQLLYKYVLHHTFGLPFTTSAQLIDRDSIFVPAGWDGEKKIDMLREGVSDVDMPLEPTRERPTIVKETVIDSEETQAFLQRLASGEKLMPLSGAGSKKLLMEDGADSSSPLASFFSSLLKEKPSGAASAGGAVRAPPTQQETEQHLDRILRGAAASQPANNENDSSA